MTKRECIESYDKQSYRILEIPINPNNPKELVRTGWNKEPTNLNIGENNLFAVVQEDNKFVIDIDDIEYNEILNDYLDKTLVVKSGSGGRHYYFKDNLIRIEQNKIRITKLYKDGKEIGDIRASGKIKDGVEGVSYVVGCGCSYFDTKEMKLKTYNKISSTDQVLEIDGYDILKILSDNGITTKENTQNVAIKGKDLMKGGVKVGNIHDALRTTALSWLGYTKNSTYEEYDRLMRAWNKTNEQPEHEPKLTNDLEDFWNYAHKENFEKRNSKDKGVIDIITKDIKEKYSFVTIRATNDILLYNGKTYSKSEAESIIKTETEKRITDCTTHDRNEVVNKIKALTGANLDDFDVDSNLVTLENGILNLETLELTDHNPSYLSRVLLPVEFTEPINQINDETIFEDIEKNLEDSLFWQFLKRSFTVNGEFRKEDFETVLEIIASPIIKRHIDEKAFMFLGNGENGKSVCLDYIKSIIGKDNISRITLQQIADDKFMVAQLAGKSANIFTDLESGELKHAGKIKAITSGEGIEAQEKYMKPFTLDPFCKLMFSCNRFPKVYDQSHAFFRRWVIVKWERSFENDPERIEYLREKLAENQEEKNLVFSCIVYLARKLNKVGKFSHTKDSKTIQREWDENAEPIDWFDTNYIKDSDKNKTKRETYHFYRKVMLSKGEPVLGMGQFSKAFAQYHDEYITKEGRTERVWLNIDFDDNILEVSDNT